MTVATCLHRFCPKFRQFGANIPNFRTDSRTCARMSAGRRGLCWLHTGQM